MISLLDRLYYRLRKDEIIKAKNILSKIKIDSVFECLTKCCWKYGIQYEILFKNKEMFIIKLMGRSEIVIIKFHRSEMVLLEDYVAFLSIIGNYHIKRSIYITTGEFEEKITRNEKGNPLLSKENRIEDGCRFIRRQLGLKGTASEIFNYKIFNFYNYLSN